MQADEHAQPTSKDRWWSAGLVALLLIPLVVSAFSLWFSVGTSYRPTTDWAIFELRARDVFDHGVFVGPYSRFGWNHPGPLLFYVLGVPYKLFGSRSISMHVTALAVNGAAIVAIGWVAFRRGRLPMVIAVLVPLALLVRALGADSVRDPWNPYVLVLPLLLLLLLCWSVAVGDIWMLPIVMAVASFTIQSHVGLAIEAVVLVGVALVGIVVRGLRTPGADRRDWWRRVTKAGIASAGVLLVLWLPVLWGTVVRDDGNLEALLKFFAESHATAGLTKGLEVLGLQWGPRPEWILGPRGFGDVANQLMERRWWMAVGLVLGFAATVIAARRRSWETVWLAGLLVGGFAAAVIAVSNVVGFVFPYLTRWTWALGAALGILVLRGAWLAVPTNRRAMVLRWTAPGAGVLLVVLGVIGTVDALDAGTPYARDQRAERRITREVVENLPPGRGPVRIDRRYGGLAVPGIALALERRGIPTQVVPDSVVLYGEHRVARGERPRAVLVPVVGDEQIAQLDPPGPRIAHYVRPWTPEARRAARRELQKARARPPGPSRTAVIENIEASLDGPQQEIAVYLADPEP